MLWTIDPAGRAPLHEQIAASVRRALAQGELRPSERLPPAAELAEALHLNRNTVLQAFRQLREEGLLEFRRGRGVRVCEGAGGRGPVVEAARALLEAGRAHGYTASDLTHLLEELT